MKLKSIHKTAFLLRFFAIRPTMTYSPMFMIIAITAITPRNRNVQQILDYQYIVILHVFGAIILFLLKTLSVL